MKRHISSACLLGALLGYGVPALALTKFDYIDIEKEGINIADGKVFINPVNGNYGQATGSSVSYHVKMRAGCKRQNTLQEAFVTFGSENVSGGILEASDNYRHLVGMGMGKTLGWSSVHLQVPLNRLGFNPATMCQNYLEHKLSQGVSRQQVLASDHVINKPVTLSAVASCGKSGNNVDYGVAKLNSQLKVICKAGAVGGIDSIQVQPPGPIQGAGSFQATTQVTNVTFKATPKTISGTCPAKARFTGAITASGPGKVRYQISFPGTEKLDIRELNFAKAGTKSIGLVEYTANNTMPVAVAHLKVLSPSVRNAYADFKVLCTTQGVGGVGNVQTQSPPDARPVTPKLKTAPSRNLKLNKVAPPAPKPPRAAPARTAEPKPTPPRARFRIEEQEKSSR